MVEIVDNFSEDNKRLNNLKKCSKCISIYINNTIKININNESSFRYLQEFIYLIIFELSIRFLTDFLQSNKYFKIKYETHNLFRAEGQYRLLSSFLSQVSNLSEELQEIGIYSSSTFVSDVQKIV